ncbi:MAG: undecaprenyl-diphosphatase [Alphaproteobacteria bacterium]|nr:undecaprenyl-diphosphatase [Alphaproteobacteria bacterium]
MPLVQLIVLAIVQGVTEFLPISSSAHLILAPLLVPGWDDQGALIDVASHVGTLLAVLVYFRSETLMLVRGGLDAVSFRPSDDRKLFLQVAAASVPIIIIGGLVAATGAIDALRNPYVIGVASIVFGVALWHGDRAATTKEGLDRISWREALAIGAAQLLAIIPGASRSGVTMTAARYLGWSRQEAARFSMLLAIPTILAVGGFAAIELAMEGTNEDFRAAAIVLVLSFLVAWGVVALFMRYTQRMNFTPFVIYRILMGVAVIGLTWRFGLTV